jgi:small subunit ribosomal protein S4
MGDPRKSRKKYKTPSHPWQKQRLDIESKLATDYGLKNKKDVWKMNSILKNFTNQSKKLVTLRTKQAEVEKLNLIKKLKSLGLIKENQGFEEILNLTIKDVMERRLQSFVHRKGLARTMKQSRQMITHEQIMVADKKITSPSYLVNIAEESKIQFSPTSPFFNSDHPELVIKKTEKASPAKKKEDKKADNKKPIKKDSKKENQKTETSNKDKNKKQEKPKKEEVSKKEKVKETKK